MALLYWSYTRALRYSGLIPRPGNKVKSTVPNTESLVVPLFEMHYVMLCYWGKMQIHVI